MASHGDNSTAGSGGVGSDGVVVQGKEETISLEYPMLSRTNYAAWAIKMKVFMAAQGVWDSVEATGQVDPRKDKMALAAIYQGISEDTLLQLGAKRTAKEAWSMLKTMNQGAEKVKEVRTQSLWRELEALKIGEGKDIEEFYGKMQIIVNKLRSLGNEVKEEQVVKRLLRNLVHHDRSRHIDTKFHFIRDCMEQGVVELEYTRTDEQVADILTKPLARKKFEELRILIGMKQV